MKARILLFFLFIAYSGILTAQDTIFVRTGQVIPAVLVEKNNTEIKYKKYGQPEPAAVYSMFTSDIKSIHYRNGITADYMQMGQQASKPENAAQMAGTMKAIRISVGLGGYYLDRSESPDFEAFWKYYTKNNSAQIGQNNFSIPVTIKMSMVLGRTGRNWFGDVFRLVSVPRAIYATGNGDSSQINLSEFHSTIALFYGRTINYKKNLVAIVESGMDLSFGLKGTVKITGKTYNDISTTNGDMGFHFAAGADWIIIKRLTADFRVGFRLNKTAKPEWFNSLSDWGYLPKISMTGLFASAGLNLNFYLKTPGYKIK